MSGCSAVADKVSDASDEGTKGEVYIADYMEWETVISKDN